MKIYVSVKNKEQFEAVKKSGRADELIVPLALAHVLPGVSSLCILMPDVLRENKRCLPEESESLIRAAKGVVIQNADEIGFLRSIGFEGAAIAGEFLYSYNSKAADFYRNIFPDIRFTAPAELTDGELSALEKAAGISFIYKVYGRQKLMTTAQHLNGPFTDEKGEKFIAAYDSASEYSKIYSGKPVSMLDKKEAWRGHDILFDFTFEDAEEICTILAAMAVSDYTRGHHFKGTD